MHLSLKSVSPGGILFYTVTTFFYIVFLLLIGRNLMSPDMWYDEAGQVFMAHGLNHWSEPLSPDGSFNDAMNANHDYNQDPGGYTALLYLWCKVSSGHVWLRLLSYLFLLGTIVFACLLSHEILGSRKLAYAGGLMVFALFEGTPAFEVRAYSMELCGLVYGLWMVFRLSRPAGCGKVLLFSLLLSFFITSRYTMLVTGGILSCFVLYNFAMLYKKGKYDGKELLWRAILYSLPLLLTVFVVWRFQMIYQNPEARPLSYIKYIDGGRPLIPFIICTIMLFVTVKWQSKKGRSLLLTFVVINLCFLILGYIKMLPWILAYNKGCLFILLLNVTMYNCFASVLMTTMKSKSYLPFIALGAWVIYVVGIRATGNMANIYGAAYNRTLAIDLALSEADGGVIYLSSWCSPEVRYLYEYGALKERAEKDGYPGRFRFLKRDRHCVGIKKIDYKRLNAETLSALPKGTVVYSTNEVTDSMPSGYRKLDRGVYVKL